MGKKSPGKGAKSEAAAVAEAAPPLFPITVDDLKEDPENPRAISDEAMNGLSFALSEFGDLSGITWNKRTGLIVTGHQRMTGLRERHGPSNLVIRQTHGDNFEIAAPSGETYKGRVVDWDEVKAKAAMLAANSPTIQGQFTKGVGTILDRLRSDAPGLLRPLMLDRLRKIAIGTIDESGSESDPEKEGQVPIEPEIVVVKPGDLWICGEHRVLCGDATKPEDYERVLSGDLADLCLTDPPYGVGEFYETHEDTKQNLATLIEKFLPLCRKKAQAVLLTPGNWNTHTYPKPDWILAWFTPAGIGSGPWGFSCWQPVLAYGKDPYLAKAMGRRPDAFSMTESAENELDHPCPKPVRVWSWIMQRGTTAREQRVLDPFLGSGTTMIAAERLRRRCFGIEIEPKYVQVAIQRWADFTGDDPVREDGASFRSLVDENKSN